MVASFLAGAVKGGNVLQPDWAIGILTGESPLHMKADPRASNPVLTAKDVSDLKAAFVADPFMLPVGGVWHMFFEVLEASTGRGQIGHAISDDACIWRYQQIVLGEDFHLSYP